MMLLLTLSRLPGRFGLDRAAALAVCRTCDACRKLPPLAAQWNWGPPMRQTTTSLSSLSETSRVKMSGHARLNLLIIARRPGLHSVLVSCLESSQHNYGRHPGRNRRGSAVKIHAHHQPELTAEVSSRPKRSGVEGSAVASKTPRHRHFHHTRCINGPFGAQKGGLWTVLYRSAWPTDSLVSYT